MIWPLVTAAVEPAADEAPEELTGQWTAVLDQLETQLMATDAGAPYWTPPTGLGRMPASLRERAHALAAAQAAAIVQLHNSLDCAAAELSRLTPARQTTSAVYLDIMG
ncbi:MAG: hypothetical protein WBX27_08825 [Specibacter sp.]